MKDRRIARSPPNTARTSCNSPDACPDSGKTGFLRKEAASGADGICGAKRLSKRSIGVLVSDFSTWEWLIAVRSRIGRSVRGELKLSGAHFHPFTVQWLTIYVVTSAFVSTVISLSVVLIHAGIGVSHRASPHSAGLSSLSAAVPSTEAVPPYRVAVAHSGLSTALGFAAAQTARNASTEDEQSKSDDLQNCTDVNTASAEDLERAKGVGPVKAKAIVDDRKTNGPYAKLEDLERVKGIGPATRENIRQAGFCVK